MSAAEIAFAFLVRGLKNDLCLSQYAALAWLAANGESDRLTIMRGIGRNVTNNRDSVLRPLVGRGLVTQRVLTPEKGHEKFLHSITPAGLRVLGIRAESKEGGKSC